MAVKKRKLSIKQQKFVKLKAALGNGAAAARGAGYSKKTAREIASQNLTKPHIREAINEALEASLKKAQLKGDHVIEQLRRIAFADIADVYNEDGSMKHPNQMSGEAKSAINSVETKEMTINGIKIGAKKKVNLADKTKALELLGKHFKLFTDVVESKIEANITTVDKTEASKIVDELESEC